MLRRPGGSALHSGELVRIRCPGSEWHCWVGTFRAVRANDGAFLVRMPGLSEPVAFLSQEVVRDFRVGDRVTIDAPNADDEHKEFDGQTGSFQRLVDSDADGDVLMRVKIDASGDGQRLATFHDFGRYAVMPVAGPLLADLQKVGSPSSG